MLNRIMSVMDLMAARFAIAWTGGGDKAFN